MNHAAAVTLLAEILIAHNAGLDAEDPKVEIPAVMKAVKVHGGTTIDGLLGMDAGDFVACGFPGACAKLAVRRLATAPASAAPVAPVASGAVPSGGTDGMPGVVVLRDERTALTTAADADLIARYDHDNPGLIGEILDARAKGQPFLFFPKGQKHVVASAERLGLLRKGRPVTPTVEIDGVVCRPYAVGDLLTDEAMKVNVLWPDEPLLEPGEVCGRTKESWAGVSQEIRGVLELAVRLGHLDHRGSAEVARGIIETAKSPDALKVIRRRYPEAAIAWDEMPVAKRPDGTFDPNTARSEGRRGLPFGGGPRGARIGSR